MCIFSFLTLIHLQNVCFVFSHAINFNLAKNRKQRSHSHCSVLCAHIKKKSYSPSVFLLLLRLLSYFLILAPLSSSSLSSSFMILNCIFIFLSNTKWAFLFISFIEIVFVLGNFHHLKMSWSNTHTTHILNALSLRFNFLFFIFFILRVLSFLLNVANKFRKWKFFLQMKPLNICIEEIQLENLHKWHCWQPFLCINYLKIVQRALEKWLNSILLCANELNSCDNNRSFFSFMLDESDGQIAAALSDCLLFCEDFREVLIRICKYRMI